MGDTAQVYNCVNPACVQGSRKDPGRFTGGITADQVNVLTGEPVENLVEGEHYGEGFCPTCGEKGVPVTPNPDEGESDVHEFRDDKVDPFQDIHNKVASEVLDPEKPEVTTDTAQDRVDELIEKRIAKGVDPVTGEKTEGGAS
jgi:hypothetical protein